MRKKESLKEVFIMDKKCKGCGVILQDSNILNPGYTTNLDNEYCQRCFRIRNYGDYKLVDINNQEYIEILKTIDETNDLVLYVTDLLNLEKILLLLLMATILIANSK